MTDATDQSLKNLDVVEAIVAKTEAYGAGGPDCELECWRLVAKHPLPEGFNTGWLEEIIATSKLARKAYDKAEEEKLAEQLKNAKPEPKPEPKEADVFISPPNALVEQKPLLPPSGQWIPECVKDFNQKHAVIGNLGGKCVVMEWVASKVTPGVEEFSYQSFTAFKERYSHKWHRIGGEDSRAVPATAVWLAHPHRRQFEGIDLVPDMPGKKAPRVLPGNVLNLWRGWGVEPRQGSWELLNQHMFEVLANGDQGFYDYLCYWVAWKLQNPGLPAEVVMALSGGKGTGKSVFGYVLLKIFGGHGLLIHSTDMLTGDHNQHLQDKLFLYLDEAFWAGDRTADRALKGLTTERYMMVNPKGLNAYQWPNRLAMLMTGNDKWLVPATHDERRYAINRVSEKHRQSPAYFDPLWAEIENGGAAAMLFDMLDWDLEGWHPREAVPQTKSLVEQKLQGLDGLEAWYLELLNNGVLPGEGVGQPPEFDLFCRTHLKRVDVCGCQPKIVTPAAGSNPRRVGSALLLEDAKRYSIKNRYVTSTEIGRFLSEQGCKKHSNGKAWGWIFPPLKEAREAWEAKSTGEWEWESDVEDWGIKPAEDMQ